ncbi:MAG: hypothetical protein GY906_30105 [bacterium]|nr:hypothetical protein [bacterium]
MTETIVGYDPRADLMKDIERDPEGHFHRSISGDRRLPPWFGSDQGSRPPSDVRDRVSSFMGDRVVGQDPAHFEVRHNWYDEQMEFIRWMPDFEYLTGDGKIALITWTPLTLEAWPARQGWLPGGEALFDFLWKHFMAHDPKDTPERQRYEAVKEAWVHVKRLSSRIAHGEASDGELEEFEHWLQIADPDGWAESYELAKEMKPIMGKMADELGV